MLLVTAYKKAGYPHLPVPLSEAFHSPTSERTEPEYPRWSVYNTPKSVLEGTIALAHTPGCIYYTRQHSSLHLLLTGLSVLWKFQIAKNNASMTLIP